MKAWCDNNDLSVSVGVITVFGFLIIVLFLSWFFSDERSEDINKVRNKWFSTLAMIHIIGGVVALCCGICKDGNLLDLLAVGLCTLGVAQFSLDNLKTPEEEPLEIEFEVKKNYRLMFSYGMSATIIYDLLAIVLLIRASTKDDVITIICFVITIFACIWQWYEYLIFGKLKSKILEFKNKHNINNHT